MSGHVEGSSPWPWEKYKRKVVPMDNDRIAWESRGYSDARTIVSLDGLEAMLERINDTLEKLIDKLDEISEKFPDKGDKK
ncbi:MAG: hypothetical protein EBS70_04275 [Actinobacteria bacterium]|jgi:hypothetical protein|nr:hypothetical protein [Actinomycetota bacterium]